LNVGTQVTVYLRKDEVKAINQLIEEHGIKRHQAIKLAIRYFLFPKERGRIPLDGKVASIHKIDGEMLHIKDEERVSIVA